MNLSDELLVFCGAAGKLLRYSRDLSSAPQELTLPCRGVGPFALAVDGADGSLWIADSARATLTRFSFGADGQLSGESCSATLARTCSDLAFAGPGQLALVQEGVLEVYRASAEAEALTLTPQAESPFSGLQVGERIRFTQAR